MTRHTSRFLYRCFGSDGRLLYVGITANVKNRLREHRASWFGYQITTTTVVEFPDRDAARAAEILAITTESPRFNRQGRWADRSDWSEGDYRDFYDATRFAPFSGYRDRRMSQVRDECLRRYGVDITPNKEQIA